SSPLAVLRPGDLFVDGRRERVIGLRARERAAVDEDRRRAGDAHQGARRLVVLDALRETAGVETLVELRLVNAEAARGRLQRRHLELALVAEHRVVHLPELALLVGAQRRLGGLLGERVD